MQNYTYYARPSPQGHYSRLPAAAESRASFLSQPSHQSQATQEPRNQPRNLKPLNWLGLYLAGNVVGMIGLLALLYTTFRENNTIRHLTYGFGATMIIVPSVVAIYWYFLHVNSPGGGVAKWNLAILQTFSGSTLAFAAAFGVFSSLYCDLVLGSIADNLVGLPSHDFAPLYWAWVVAKRLPMLSI